MKRLIEDLPSADYDVLTVIKSDNFLSKKIRAQVKRKNIIMLCYDCFNFEHGACRCVVQIMFNFGFDVKKLHHFPADYLLKDETCQFYAKTKTKFDSLIS